MTVIAMIIIVTYSQLMCTTTIHCYYWEVETGEVLKFSL